MPSPAAELNGRVGSRRRNKFRIVRFRINAKTHSPHLFRLSKSNPLRWASIWFGTNGRVHPHTASVLTCLKIEERQLFDGRSLYAPKCLCSNGFRLRQVTDPLEISLEIQRKQTDLPRGGLRPSERPIIKKESFSYMEKSIQNLGLYLTLVSQLDKLARHNRQGSYRTKERYYEAFKRFCAFLADEYHLQKLENISGKHLSSYVLWMQESGKSASTIKTDLAAIRFFQDKMSRPKYRLPSNEELAVELERRRFGGADRTWSNAEFNKLLGKAMGEDRWDYILALYLGRFAGLRIHECFRIDTATAEDALRKNIITIKGKGGKVRTVPINEQISIALREQLKRTPRGHKLLVLDNTPTHQAIHKLQFFIHAHREAFQEDTNRPLTFHGLRHTYAAEQYQKLTEGGMSALGAHFAVSQLLGHERADVTNIYLASLPKGEHYGK